MNIQIFGKAKCFDTKKAERYFKERKINYQLIDLKKYSMSKGEFASVRKNFQSIDELVDEKSKDALLVKYLAYEEDKVEKILENSTLLKTPIVRNGAKATIGYQPDVWKDWK